MMIDMNKIKIGQRIREDYGDMQSLVDSIKEYGLLHPIVVDANHNLIAGCRRFLACERVGMKEIEVKMLGEISEKELRVLELEENLRRKDLTSYEKSKNLVELAEIKEKAHLEKEMDFRTDSVRKSHRPTGLNSLGSLAVDIGVPKQTLADAKNHVAAIDKYPDLEKIPKYKAMETAKKRDEVIDLAQRRNKQKKQDETTVEFNAYMDKCYKTSLKYHDALYKLKFLEVNDTALKEFAELAVSDIGDGHSISDDYVSLIQEAIPKLLKIEKYLKEAKHHEKIYNFRK